jgi:predicted metal-binding protein
MDDQINALGQFSKRDNQADFERYRQLAIALGAADAKIISARDVKIDERVRLKCTIPRCARAGQTPNCPPFAPDLEIIRKAVSLYSTAVLFKCNVLLNEYENGGEGNIVAKRQAMLFHKKGAEVVNEIERQAFRDGYHLAMGLAGGSCKDYLCEGQPCQSLENRICRFPLQSRPSIEAMGIDITTLINEAGWATYALTGSEYLSQAITVGLVFIV